MKNKINRKYLFDAVMTIILLLLMDYKITGLMLHEWLGIAVFILFAAHKLLNYKWIKNITLNFFDKKIKPRIKVMYVLDVLLLVFVITVTASGILISDNIFTFSLQDRSFWVNIHDISAYGSLIVISVHIGMHWKAVMNAARKVLRIKKPNVLRTWIVRISALLLIAAGVKSSFDKRIGEKFLLFADPPNKLANDTPLLHSENSKTSKTQSEMTSDFAQETVPSLEEYLGSLHCTLCSNHCPLLAPQCSKGKTVAAQAEITYNSLYAEKDNGVQSALSDDTNILSKNKADDSKNAGNILNTFADYLPIMGLYIGSTYYIIELTIKRKH